MIKKLKRLIRRLILEVKLRNRRRRHGVSLVTPFVDDKGDVL